MDHGAGAMGACSGDRLAGGGAAVAVPPAAGENHEKLAV